MIISRTPFRVSLFGGGTDYPSYYEAHGGLVIGFALSHHCYIQVRKLPPFFGHRHRVVYSRIELVRESEEVEHPTTRAVLHYLRDLIRDDGLEIHHHGDLPAWSGLGSSSSFVVGLLAAVYALYGVPVYAPRLAEEAIHLEREVVGDSVGNQDQTIAAYGGLLRAEFSVGFSDVRRLGITRTREQELVSHLAMVFTGITRRASQIAKAQNLRSEQNEPLLHEMKRIAQRAETFLSTSSSGGMSGVGAMLHESWMLKRSLSSLVSTPLIDDLYDASREAGATGGKVMGAGGGGFMLFMAPPESHPRLHAALREACADRSTLVPVPVGIDPYGSRVVLRAPNGLGDGSGVAP